MTDPYKVLNIAPTASDDEVKHAYRELARKYHPDNYHDNPLADLAQEKMKEINEAYEQIQKQRRAGASYTASSAQGYGYSGASYSTASSSPLMQRVRMAINSGDITTAERLLNEAPEHDAEWNFLMGVVCSRRGWMDDAKRCLETACRMDPNNAEYRQALQMFSNSGGYRPQGYRVGGTMTYGGDTCMNLCAAWSCCILSGGHCCIC
ncbi:MAG: DnaJ domain-containing protein [Oscillospiraceae bacterium]|nr:DnaJ domain-containing protein [Oscillospiraceae bacterium]